MSIPTLEEKKEKRLKEWKVWIDTFLTLNKPNPAPDYAPIPFAAELVNEFYWGLYSSSLKILLHLGDNEPDHNLHYYKIISASELAIMSVLPFTFVDEHSASEEDRIKVNAEFAWFVGISILMNWESNKPYLNPDCLAEVFLQKEVIYVNADGSEMLYPLNFMDEHIEWLTDVNVAAGPLPILINSHTWRLLFLAAKDKLNHKNSK